MKPRKDMYGKTDEDYLELIARGERQTAMIRMMQLPPEIPVHRFAAISGKDIKTVRRMCALGLLKAKKQGGTWRIRRESALEYLGYREEDDV